MPKILFEEMSRRPPTKMKAKAVPGWLVGVEAYNKSVRYFNALSEEDQHRSDKYCKRLLDYCDPTEAPKIAHLSDADFLAFLQEHNKVSMAEGVAYGWWPEYDDVGPIMHHNVNLYEFELYTQGQTYMSHIMCALGFFDSVSKAKKNGWGMPARRGMYKAFNGRRKVFVI